MRDVIDAAEFRGELQAPWRELLRRMACESAAAEEEREADEATIEESVSSAMTMT